MHAIHDTILLVTLSFVKPLFSGQGWDWPFASFFGLLAPHYSTLKFAASMGLPFSLDAEKGKCCMWLVNKVEISFAKVGFIPTPYGPI